MTEYRFSVQRLCELECWKYELWNEFFDQQPIKSPFIHPAFSKAVAEVRPHDSYISVMIKGDEIVGFLPHHQTKNNRIMAIGDFLNDFQGPIVKQGIRWQTHAWLNQTGFPRLAFNHMPSDQETFRTATQTESISPLIATHENYEKYLERLKKARGRKPNTLSQAARHHRKLCREFGLVEFKSASRKQEDLKELKALKSAQYIRTKVPDIFKIDWASALIDNLNTIDTDGFSGRLSTLSVNGTPAALHFGIRSKDIWHYWFPAYDTRYSNYSVGVQLLTEMIKAAHEEGFKFIDLGKGEQRYKNELKTGEYQLMEGIVARKQWFGDLDYGLHTKIIQLKQSPVGQYLKKSPLGRLRDRVKGL